LKLCDVKAVSNPRGILIAGTRGAKGIRVVFGIEVDFETLALIDLFRSRAERLLART
jgi:hypothetical protein